MVREQNTRRVQLQRKALAQGQAIELIKHAVGVANQTIVAIHIDMMVAAENMNTPRGRLSAHFGVEADALWEGMRAFVSNCDVPTPETLALIHCAGGSDPSVELLDSIVSLLADELDVTTLPDRCIAALAAQYTGKACHADSKWMAKLADSHTDTVADAVQTYLDTSIRQGRWSDHFLRLEIDDTLFAPHPFIKLARRGCFEFLRHARSCHGDVLRTLLHVALAQDPARLRATARTVLTDTRLAPFRRGYWITAAFLAGEDIGDDWSNLMNTGGDAVLAAFWFIGIALSETGIRLALDTERCVRFIEVFTKFTAAFAPQAQNHSDVIVQLINNLAGDPSSEASKALTRFSGEPACKPWADHLLRAVEIQSRVRRETVHIFPSLADIVTALKGGPPATAADRLALVADVIEQLGRELRHGSSDGWRPFWNPKDATPQLEDGCRNYLLTLLRAKLHPLDLTVEREGDFALHGRADLVIHQGTGKTPIEIKRHWNPTLWEAPTLQLRDKYMGDPACQGLGIFLVLWFEGSAVPPPPKAPTGITPTTPDQLLNTLQELHPGAGIKFIVLDCGRQDLHRPN